MDSSRSGLLSGVGGVRQQYEVLDVVDDGTDDHVGERCAGDIDAVDGSDEHDDRRPADDVAAVRGGTDSGDADHRTVYTAELPADEGLDAK